MAPHILNPTCLASRICLRWREELRLVCGHEHVPEKSERNDGRDDVPTNRVGEIDFMGAMGPLLPPRTPIVFAIGTGLLAIVALADRKRQLTN